MGRAGGQEGGRPPFSHPRSTYSLSKNFPPKMKTPAFTKKNQVFFDSFRLGMGLEYPERLREVLEVSTSSSVYGKWKQAKQSERKANK